MVIQHSKKISFSHQKSWTFGDSTLKRISSFLIQKWPPSGIHRGTWAFHAWWMPIASPSVASRRWPACRRGFWLFSLGVWWDLFVNIFRFIDFPGFYRILWCFISDVYCLLILQFALENLVLFKVILFFSMENPPFGIFSELFWGTPERGDCWGDLDSFAIENGHRKSEFSH